MQPLPDGSFPYAGPVDCALKTLREEGPLKFYTGFPTYCIRSVMPSSSLFSCAELCGRSGILRPQCVPTAPAQAHRGPGCPGC